MNTLFSIIALITCTISQTTVVDVVIDNNLTALADALTSLGLVSTLQGTGPFTVFAPTNDAFTAVSPLPNDSAVVTDILLYHVIDGATVLSGDLSDGLIAATMNGQSITVQIDGSDVYFYDSNGRRAMPTVVDLVADNGVVHIIDMVLLPDGKISDITSNVADLSSLNGALEAYGLNSTLASPGNFTLFAPTNDAVAAFTGTIDVELLLYHVLGAVVEAADVPTTSTIVSTVSGYNLTVYRNDSGVFVMDTFGRKGQVTVANLVATNGIVHIIDIVLAPTATIAELVSFRDDLTTLSSVLSLTGLDYLLNNDSYYLTLFAPTDAAFDAITVPTNLSDVAGILAYHVLAGGVFSTDLSSGLVASTVFENQSISVQIDGGVFIYDTMGRASQVTEADLSCTNGVIHIIDTVLLPDGTIADVTSNVPELSTLDGALVAYGLNDTLATTGPFTLFAPSNDAVSAFQDVIDDQLLLYHVLAGQFLAKDVPETATALPTANTDMDEVTVERNDSGVFITDAIGRKGQVTMANVVSTNGVVHVIDIVLQSTPSIVELVSSRDDLSTLAGALELAGLISTLEGDGPFTIFAPTNAAFDAITVPDNVTELTNILLYHVVNNATVLSTDLESGSVAETLISQSISVQIDGGVFIYDTMGMTSEVTEADLECRNGVIHIIDAVLIPDGTIADVTANIAKLSSLNGALEANSLDDTLMTTGPFTLFAPTNDAVSMFTGTIDTELLLYHVTTPQYLAADVPTTSTALMSANTDMDEFTVIRNDSGVFITDAVGRVGQVTVANIVSTNGVVHIIDIVLAPSPFPSIVELVKYRSDLTTLAGALETAGLISALSGDGPFTVFAPTNDAFDAITVPSNVTELTKILKYHVLASEVVSGDLESALVKETLISQSISFQIDNGVFIYDTMGITSEVTEADLDCTNGVIHIIDAVLLPDGTIADVTANIDSLSTLHGALVANDLDDVLMTDGPFTLFAPTNAAVSAFDGTIDSEVLLYHVLSGQYLAGDVPTTATALATANSDMTELTVVRNDNGVFVTDQEDRTGEVTMANIISTNGVVHIIDIVLSPEDIMDISTTEEPDDPGMSSVNKLSPSLAILFFCFVCLFNIF